MHERALSIRRRILPPSHPWIATTLRNLARVQGKLGDVERAASSLAASIAVARRSQSYCSGPGCVRRQQEDGAPLDVCVKCRCTFYCGKACQTSDWKAGHKAECKALIAEAATSTAL